MSTCLDTFQKRVQKYRFFGHIISLSPDRLSQHDFGSYLWSVLFWGDNALADVFMPLLMFPLLGDIRTFPIRAYRLDIGERTFRRPAFKEFWVLASRYRITIAYFHKRWRLDALAQY